MDKIICIVGPTASGKTRLSVELAKALGAEIVSCDSMQIYKYMDIGTAKPTEAEKQGIVHHMMDFLDPRESYSVSRYVEDADPIVQDILARGKPVVIVGGTGLYLDSLIAGRQFAPFPQSGKLRACASSIKALYSDKKVTALFQPHLYSRTADFYREFAQSLSLFDKVILVDIYPAREEPIPGVTSKLIYDCLDAKVEKRMCSRADVLKVVEEEKEDIEVLVSLGAGDIENEVPKMKEILLNR